MDFVVAFVAVVLVVGSIAGSIVGNMIASELYDHMPSFAIWLIKRAASKLPEHERARYLEEWLAHLSECAGNFRKLWHAMGCWLGAQTIAATVSSRSDGSPTTSTIAHASVLNRISFRTALLEVMSKLAPGALGDPIYYTAQFELFALSDASGQTQETLRGLNIKLFEQLAMSSLRNDGPGLRLIVHYRDGESENFGTELSAMYQIIRRVAARNSIELDCSKFLVRRTAQRLSGRYYVVDRHVFRVETHTSDPNDWEYIRVTNPEIAQNYRRWLAELFIAADEGPMPKF